MKRFLLPLHVSTVCVLLASAGVAQDSSPVDIGSHRELFVDDALVEKISGGAELRLHHPEPREMVLVHDAPWEGTGSGFHTIFRDGPLYKMYYKAAHIDVLPGKIRPNAHPLFCCYAESDDGIHWRKPELGLYEFNGSKANNIVMVTGKIDDLDVDAGHCAVFKDENPAATPDARYKAFFRSRIPKGVHAFKSPDGLHWSPMTDHPVLTEGAFDSQNLAFWDVERGEYRAYWRMMTPLKRGGFRGIRTGTSKDFLNWENQTNVLYVDSPIEHLYINQVRPYYRAPQIYIGFPARYTVREINDSMRALPDRENREWRGADNPRYGAAITESLLMAGRDGVTFKRWNEGFLRPGLQRSGTWNYAHQFLAWHVVETPSAIEDAPPEMSLYASESYWTGKKGSQVRRYTMRLDGFVSVSAPMKGGELLTKTITFTGAKLRMNFSSSAAGGIQVELQDAAGAPIPGFTLNDCPSIFGDEIERVVTWSGGGDVSALAGRPVRLHFVLQDADLFSFRFGD